MPWKIFQDGKDGDYCVHKVNDDGSKGELVHCHGTDEAKAQAQMRALYASKNQSVIVDPSRLFTNKFRTVSNDGRDFIVVSGIPAREQVMNTYLVPGDELARSIRGWNGVPITISHPTLNDGSANVPAPDVAIIGRFYNAAWENEGRRMSGEYWIDVAEAGKYTEGQAILNKVKAGEVLETSTGYWAEDENHPGEFGGRQYKTIHRNLLPDHIAVFSTGVSGACSIKDGCGVNRNAGVVQNCAECGECPFHNESMDQKMQSIRNTFYIKFRQTDNPQMNPLSSDCYIREIYDSYVIVEEGTDIYKVAYTQDEAGGYSFADRGQWARVKLEYVETNAAIPDYMKDHLPTSMLIGYSFNKGLRTPEQLAGLRTHIQAKGIDKPVMVMRKKDGEIKILDGNHRVAMAGEMDIDQIPVKVFNEDLEPVDPESMYNEWKHKTDQAYINTDGMKEKPKQNVHSRPAPAALKKSKTKESHMDLKSMFNFLQGKGITVKANDEATEFEIEETTPAPADGLPGLSAEEIAALKQLAAVGTVLNAQVLQDLKDVPTAVQLVKNIQAQEKAEKDGLIATIKTNAANIYTDEELAAMPAAVLTKLNAQMTTSYAGLGGAMNLFGNEEVLVAQPALLYQTKKEE
jgi:hypothetical protein